MNELPAQPRFAAIVLGMVPYERVDTTGEVMFEYFPETIRLSMVRRSFEWIAEGIPCLEADWEKNEAVMVPPEEREQEVSKLCEGCEQGDLDHFPTTPKTASCYCDMLKRDMKKKYGFV
jgi:hypothetical protein